MYESGLFHIYEDIVRLSLHGICYCPEHDCSSKATQVARFAVCPTYRMLGLGTLSDTKIVP
jgi:hypothetical protein